jgi:predicted GIY-YIG superfamily endonuclease
MDCDKVVNNQKWSVYILQCGDKTLYTGISNDVSKRIAQHRAGIGARYTRGRLPVRLLYKETYADKSRALKREYAIKRLGRKEKIKLTKLHNPPAGGLCG